MSRTGKIISGAGGVILFSIIVVVIFFSTFDWNRLKPTISQRVSAELDRRFTIRGDLGLNWQRNPDETGWRAWVLWPHIHAEEVVLGNPPGIPEPAMIFLPRVEATLDPLALLTKDISLPWIKLQHPVIRLERTADRKNNWTFKLAGGDAAAGSAPSSAWRFHLDSLLFDKAQISLRDAINQAQVNVTVNPLGKPVPYDQLTGEEQDVPRQAASDFVFGWQAQGSWNNQPLSGEGKTGGMLPLRSKTLPFPLQAEIRNGNTRVRIAGVIRDVLHAGGANIRLRFSGDSLSDLYHLTGVLLPDTPPYETNGHLRVRLDRAAGAVFHYDNFNGRIGESDIHGSLTYTRSKPRPVLSGTLESRQLRMADLGPLIGVNSGQGSGKSGGAETRRQEASSRHSDRVLPHDKFDSKSWSVMDADVKFSGKRIERSDALPLSDIYTHLVLKNGELLLDPLRFGIAGGNLNTTVRLEGDRSPLRARADLHARRLQLKQLFPDTEAMKSSMGQINGDATLTGSGNSVADLLATSNGDLKLLMNDGLISRNLMEIIGLNVGNYVVGKLFGDEEVRINCAAADLSVKDGVASSRLFVFDTENALVNITGTTNFASERLDLTVNPESKGMRVVTLRSPLYVRGTFKNPDAGVKAGPLLARGGAAVALGTVVGPAAALLALISPSEGEQNTCTQVLQQMKQQK